MIEAKLQTSGPEVLASIKATSWRGIVRAATFLQTSLMQELNVSNPRPYDSPSSPGESPRKRTGFLQGNVTLQLDEAKLTARVGYGANAFYGAFLELGTRHMLARPAIENTLKKTIDRLRALAAAE